MRLIVTDLTEMSAGNFCVAGWDAQGQRMVRPLPGGQNWTGPLLQQHAVRPGRTVDVVPTRRAHPGAYPHTTEDTEINPANIQQVATAPVAWFGKGAPPADATVDEAFGGHIESDREWKGVRQSVYVAAGTRTNSLAAVSLPRRAVKLVEDFQKLKAILDDGDEKYMISVSSNALKAAWRQGRLAGAQNALPAGPRFHIRLGLARAFGNPADKCYLMVNGIYS